MEFKRQVSVNFGEREWQGLTKLARRDGVDLPQLLRRLGMAHMRHYVPIGMIHHNPTPEQQKEIDSKTPALEEAYEDERDRPIWIERALNPGTTMTAVLDPVLLDKEIKRAKEELANATREQAELREVVEELEKMKKE